MSPHARLREQALFKAAIDDRRIPAPPPDSGFTLEDVLLAREAWRKAASAVYRGLLDAQPVNGQ